MKKMIDKWLESYNKLDRKYDSLREKAEKYEKNGDAERAKTFNERMDYIIGYQDGMIEALNIFGYFLQYQDGENVVVVAMHECAGGMYGYEYRPYKK